MIPSILLVICHGPSPPGKSSHQKAEVGEVGSTGRLLRGGKVEVETRLDGSLAVRFKGTYLEFVEIEGRPSKRRRPAPTHPGASRILSTEQTAMAG